MEPSTFWGLNTTRQIFDVLEFLSHLYGWFIAACLLTVLAVPLIDEMAKKTRKLWRAVMDELPPESQVFILLTGVIMLGAIANLTLFKYSIWIFQPREISCCILALVAVLIISADLLAGVVEPTRKTRPTGNTL